MASGCASAAAGMSVRGFLFLPMNREGDTMPGDNRDVDWLELAVLNGPGIVLGIIFATLLICILEEAFPM